MNFKLFFKKYIVEIGIIFLCVFLLIIIFGLPFLVALYVGAKVGEHTNDGLLALLAGYVSGGISFVILFSTLGYLVKVLFDKLDEFDHKIWQENMRMEWVR